MDNFRINFYSIGKSISLSNRLLTSLVFKLGVDRDELDPERDGGLSAEGFELLPPGLSFPLSPMLSRESTA